MSNTETSNFDEFYDNLDSIYTPMDIYTAASLGDVSYFMKYDVRKLTNQLSVPNQVGWTPLMYACSRGHSLLVNYLLMLGAKRNCKSKSGVTPLMLAVSSADIATVESVFDFSGLEERDYRKWTPLFYAVHFTREKCLKYLLTRGADVNVADFQNETPLMKAIKLGRETMVELLLKSARNLDVVSYKQESAIMLANESNNLKIQALIKNHNEYLKKYEKSEEILNVTPVKNSFAKKKSKFPLQHCSPTPLKQQLKSQLSHIKMSRSLMYSPNKTPTSSPSPKMDPWKWSFAKNFWSPQLRPHNDVEKFLKSLGLEKYWPIFRDEEVDFETLLTLNEENLKELGIVCSTSEIIKGYPICLCTSAFGCKIPRTVTWSGIMIKTFGYHQIILSRKTGLGASKTQVLQYLSLQVNSNLLNDRSRIEFLASLHLCNRDGSFVAELGTVLISAAQMFDNIN